MQDRLAKNTENSALFVCEITSACRLCSYEIDDDEDGTKLKQKRFADDVKWIVH